MAEGKKNFWTTVPGIISGIAATITGLLFSRRDVAS